MVIPTAAAEPKRLGYIAQPFGMGWQGFIAAMADASDSYRAAVGVRISPSNVSHCGLRNTPFLSCSSCVTRQLIRGCTQKICSAWIEMNGVFVASAFSAASRSRISL